MATTGPMRLDLGSDLLAQIREMGREIERQLPLGETLTADAVLLPTSSVETEGIYEPMWATTQARWVTRGEDDTLIFREGLPEADLFQEDAIR